MEDRATAEPVPVVAVVGLVGVLVVALVLLLPVFDSGFVGDDYVLWNVGQQLLADPGLLMTGPDNFYRPVNTWLFAAGDLLFGIRPLGYHLLAMALHLGCGLLLGLVALRIDRRPWFAVAASALWLVSPYTFEPVSTVNVAFNDLTVLAGWLGLAVVWPRGRWRVRHAVTIVVLVLFTALSKESWVILPALVVACERWLRGRTWSQTAVAAGLAAVPVVVYVAVYLVAFPGRDSYYEPGLYVVSRVAHVAGAFLHLVDLQHRSGFGPGEAAGLVAVVVLAGIAWFRRSRLAWFGLVLWAASLVPVLAIPWLPTRYTAAPYAGFVLLVVGVFASIWDLEAGPATRLLRTVVVAGAGSLLVLNVVGVDLEVRDLDRMRAPHLMLEAEMQDLAGRLPAAPTFVAVRAERRTPLEDLAHEGDLGIEKARYIRSSGPYGLVSWPGLLSYCRRMAGGEEIYLPANRATGEPPPGFAVVVHTVGGFRLPPASEPTAHGEADRWKATGALVTLAVRVDAR